MIPVRETNGGCPTLSTVRVLGRKWTIPIIEEAYFSGGRVQFNSLRRSLPGITQRTLSEALDGLCNEAIFTKRSAYLGGIHSTEYRLTKKGEILEGLVQGIKREGSCLYGLGKNCKDKKCGECALFNAKAK